MDPIIPTVDFASDTPEKQAEIIKNALGSVGFFAVLNAGPKVEDTEAMFEHSKSFFSLSMADKELYLAGKSGSGYTKLLSQALGEGKRDHKETFSYGKYCSLEEQPMPSPFKDDSSIYETIKRFYDGCHEVSERLMELFALALELPKEHFRQSHSYGLNTAMSLIHYPALSKNEEMKLTEMDIRAGEHRDWGTLTMLFQSSTPQPGLQISLPRSIIHANNPSRKNGNDYEDTYEWYDAPVPAKGGFLVNVGLGMELWSNGMYKATLHRVIFPVSEGEKSGTTKDRYSMAFFVQPDDNVAFQPILPGGKIDNTIKAITSGELFNSKLQESMDRFKAIPNVA
ncbi:uncharacterized protein IL334_002029 [Kwoniella shivajii]|uniref:Fe2OG dioxygenase domain-containing protein n=1 Tax=Kwoniella shivajii TaxID=564305 RepID=A0ABZ1CUP5_9TREE|nr:hypothetical protein IL334_002029 [Kwoniella shivajii]